MISIGMFIQFSELNLWDLVFEKSKAPKRTSGLFCFNKLSFTQMARVTLPERKQRVQAYTLRGEPLTIALTLLTLGFQVLLERLCE